MHPRRRLAPLFALSAFAGNAACEGRASSTAAAPAAAELAPSKGEARLDRPDPAADDAPPPSPSPKPNPGGLDGTMRAHFEQATQIQQAVIDGDLAAIENPAKWLGEELPRATLPDAWGPQIAGMQEAAAAALAAKDLPAAAAAAGRLVGSCGACHQALGQGPSFPALSVVPEGETTALRMQRHQWAADRMWEAMVARSDARWAQGAAAVSVAPPTPCPIPDAHVLPADALRLREKIYELGDRAAAASDWDARTAIYGEYLATCAGCHVGGC